MRLRVPESFNARPSVSQSVSREVIPNLTIGTGPLVSCYDRKSVKFFVLLHERLFLTMYVTAWN